MIERDSRDDFERIRLSRAARVWPRPDLSGGGVPAFVGRVTSSASSIAVGHFLRVQPCFVLGTESEGSAGILSTIGTATVPVYLVGPGLPSTGDNLVCKFVDHRWVAERSNPSGGGTGGSGTVAMCYCAAVPVTLTMTSGSTTCNYGMFQNCTIQYGPVPSVYAGLELGSEVFLSVESFHDTLAELLNPSFGPIVFQYLFTCQDNQFFLSRVYASHPEGSPYRDGYLYTWFVGSYGNSCSPFHLDNGTAYPGSDASCFVTIDS